MSNDIIQPSKYHVEKEFTIPKRHWQALEPQLKSIYNICRNRLALLDKFVKGEIIFSFSLRNPINERIALLLIVKDDGRLRCPVKIHMSIRPWMFSDKYMLFEIHRGKFLILKERTMNITYTQFVSLGIRHATIYLLEKPKNTQHLKLAP
ncbi:MAG: hypothetical protein J7L62_00930 [Candidatus Aminicenantes bacterium]|nr:hypothetical protein [Candidatus Aminicenantes bacterium]